MVAVNLAGNASRSGGEEERSFFLGTGCESVHSLISYTIYRMTKAVNDFGRFTAHQLGVVLSCIKLMGARV